MPKKAKEMTPLEVKRLQHPGRGRNVVFAVGGVSGLLLQVTPAGARSWLLRAQVGDRRREIGLGGYPDVSLAQARERAREARDAIRRGIDPVEERKAARAALLAAQKRGLTFAGAIERFLETKLPEFRNAKHAKQWRASLDAYAKPAIGGMLVDQIEVSDIARLLEPIWTTKTETAKRLRGRVEAVLSWARVAGHRTGENPARWKDNLDSLLPKPGKVAKVENYPALKLADAPAWFTELRSRKGMAARALEFLTITAARSGEVRGATWKEIDLETRLWTIPAARMKMNREHRVALPEEAVELLKALPMRSDSSYVFPAVRGGTLSDMSLSAAMRRIQEAEEAAGRRGYVDRRSGRPAVPHGLRSTFRDWAAERTEYPAEMAELALAHAVGGEVERAYRRTDMLEKRRRMMREWIRFLQGHEAPQTAQFAGAAA